MARSMAGFADTLRQRGLEIGLSESADALAALANIDVLDETRFAAALRACMAKSPEARLVFDDAFDAFWHARIAEPARPIEAEDDAAEQPAQPAGGTQSQPARGDGDSSQVSESDNSHGASAADALMQRDLASVGADEQAAIEALIRELGQQLALRESRRWRARRRGRLDMRQTLEQAIRHSGEVTRLHYRQRPRQRPRLVVLADVSYSMDAYSRFFLAFVHAFSRVFRSVESFVFATRLTHVSRALAHGRLESALDALADDVQDWAGGTRIGSSLNTYLTDFADHQLDRNTLVMIVSDGWDAGEPRMLDDALEAVRARCRAIVWLDPLMDHPRYFASALASQHQSPHVDLCVPARNLEALSGLVGSLADQRWL